MISGMRDFKKKQENRMLKFLKRLKSLFGVINYRCPQCGFSQKIPKRIVYDFTKGKESHPGGTTSFNCLKCGTPMQPVDTER